MLQRRQGADGALGAQRRCAAGLPEPWPGASSRSRDRSGLRCRRSERVGLRQRDVAAREPVQHLDIAALRLCPDSIRWARSSLSFCSARRFSCCCDRAIASPAAAASSMLRLHASEASAPAGSVATCSHCRCCSPEMQGPTEPAWRLVPNHQGTFPAGSAAVDFGEPH